MKRIVLLALIVIGFNTVKAQQSSIVKLGIKLTDSLNYFKPDIYQAPKSLLLQPFQTNSLVIPTDKNSRIVYSRMPVVKVSSNDRMPVVGMGELTNQDNMPELKVVTIDPLTNNKQPTP